MEKAVNCILVYSINKHKSWKNRFDKVSSSSSVSHILINKSSVWFLFKKYIKNIEYFNLQLFIHYYSFTIMQFQIKTVHNEAFRHYFPQKIIVIKKQHSINSQIYKSLSSAIWGKPYHLLYGLGDQHTCGRKLGSDAWSSCWL